MKGNITMKLSIGLAILLTLFFISNGCKKDENNPASSTAAATEVWNFIMDYDSSSYGQTTFEKKSDGTISGKATWQYVYQGITIQCPFEGGTVTVADTIISISAQGTATNAAAPAGYQTSPFTLSVSGIAHNGESYGAWSINFSTTGWPSSAAGMYTAMRQSGSGITR